MPVPNIEALKAKLQKVAAKATKTDDEDEDFNPCDWSGGNFDDAYNMGVDDGEIHFAREILAEFFGD